MSRELQNILSSGEISDLRMDDGYVPTSDSRVANKGYVDSLENVTFVKQVVAPAYAEGMLFYEDEHKSLTFYTDIADFSHNLGQELTVRVVNDTLATIVNGTACKIVGVGTGTMPAIEAAQADNLYDSIVAGVVTHDIAAGAEGFLTTKGVVHDFDTSAYTTGDVLYLSETVAGGLTTTPPSITSGVAKVLEVGAAGSMYVSTMNLIAIPNIFALLQGLPDTYNLTTAYQNLVNYDVAESFIATAVDSTGIITTPNGGKFRATVNITMAMSSTSSTRSIDVQIYDITAAASVMVYAIPIPRDTTSVSRSFAVPVDITASDQYVIRMKASTSMAITFDSAAFDIEAIKVSG